MTGLQKRVLIASSLLIALLALTSCGTSGPQAGTPAYAWQAAQKDFASGDVTATATQLADITKSDNEFSARAQTWKLILSTGLAEGYISLADAYQAGGKASGEQMPVAFRRKLSDYRSMAASRALEVGQTLLDWQKSNKDQNIALDFPFPPATMTDLPEVVKIKNGGMIADAVMPAVENKVLLQSVAKVMAGAAGAAGDTAKAQAVFQAGNVQVPRDTFLVAIADNLYDLAQLFSRGGVDQVDRLEWMSNKGLEILKSVKETSDSKDLGFRFELLLKDAKR
jgi:hypothetical protein